MTDNAGNGTTAAAACAATAATGTRARLARMLRRVARAAAVVSVVAAVSAAGACSSPIGLPVGGGVQAFSSVEQQTQRVYTNPEGPAADDQPEGIVEGFFNAMPAGVQSDGYRVARQFLTSQASEQWKGDLSAIIYDGTPNFTRKATAQTGSPEASGGIVVEVELNVVGRLDSHGLYTPEPSNGSATVLTYAMAQSGGQWRISRLPDGVAVSSADFEQVFRQVSVYQLDAAGKHLVPDVRWLSWRNWRTQAVREVLDGGSAWLGDAVRDVNTTKTALAVDSVPVTDGKPHVQLTGEFLRLDQESRVALVHLIRLTLGDGVSSAQVQVSVDGGDYSTIDSGFDLDNEQPNVGLYTLTDGRVVSLGSSSPLRVGETDGYPDARGFAFSQDGGAVLRADGVVECLKADASSCGVMFSGARPSFISGGLDGEIWAVSDGGHSLYVSRGGVERHLSVGWLGAESIRAVTVSPEGARLALALDDGVVMVGVSRDDNLAPAGLSDQSTEISRQRDVTMMTFYNDLNLIYIVGAESQDSTASGAASATRQRGYRQIAPGPASDQRLPDSTVVSLASGQIALYRRLAVLDDLGVVRSVSGSLDGSWSIADSQVTALGAQ
ncbi:LpqB family beta-propeller domain-containing protein [Bifidobacterium parmae]|uniref:Lipoprotein LpqB n=1 Tax=Bifidobacterium parmae TaxID=361854 RepID=A0A2N5IZV5_9BIFI|nr:LpqB family beta-propeller domain-containing protein [Bifidobacterium parmae]PLS27489.1 lipoprotein LpqB [Bifidobacterium parmae]